MQHGRAVVVETVIAPPLQKADLHGDLREFVGVGVQLYGAKLLHGDLRLDAAVAAAYGFPADLSDEQILERLLALNQERAAEEAKAAKPAKPKTSRAKQTDEML